MGWLINAHAPATLPTGEISGTHCIGGWVGPRADLDGCGKSRPPPGFDPRTVQPVASRYTDWAIPARTVTWFACTFAEGYRQQATSAPSAARWQQCNVLVQRIWPSSLNALHYTLLPYTDKMWVSERVNECLVLIHKNYIFVDILTLEHKTALFRNVQNRFPADAVLPDNTQLRHAHCAFDTQRTAG
jgi:hypothetical protein